MLVANIFGFMSPVAMELDHVFTVQAVMLCIMGLPMLYFYKASPESPSSMKPKKDLKDYPKIYFITFVLQ